MIGYFDKAMRVSVLLLAVISCSLFSCSKHTNPSSVSGKEESAPADFLSGEIRPASSKPCFQGAYYRKVVSSHDVWVGINGTVVLPQLHFDADRINPAKPQQYLDNPSIYLGGSMGNQETDIGLAWEVIKDANGVVSADRKAFRPFLRRTSHASGQKAVFENGPAESQYYWYPGEEVYMSVVVISDKKLRFIVEGAGKRFERDFDCDGYTLNGKGEFKRVNAIDQVANEGKPAQPTKTRVINSVWKKTSLYRNVSGKIVEVPFHDGRYTSMKCPSTNNFLIKATKTDLNIGSETIDISGSGF